MKAKLFWAFFSLMFLPFVAESQTSKILPWQPSDEPSGRLVYHPEPILFVHGINANDGGWGTALSALQPAFQGYWISFDTSAFIVADQSSGRYRAPQHTYLHTFNYGDLPNASTRDRQSFDTIRWNAWATDRDNWPLTNPYTGAQTGHPTDNRQTLDERVTQIRNAYAVTINGNPIQPQIILVAHSMGGLLSHYYLLNKPTDHGVRRLVTMATPHLGSHVANCKGTSV